MAQRESKLARNTLSEMVPNNSDKAALRGNKETEKIKPIVKKGNATKRKRTVGDKIKDAFFGESDNLKEYIFYDVMIPAFRDTMSEMGFGIIERFFGGGRSRYVNSRNITRNRGRSYVSYGSRTSYNDGYRDIDRGARARHEFDHIVFTNRGEAEDVLAHLVDMTQEYGEATVRAFYELSNIEASHADERYGWVNLRDAYVDRSREGHVIIFPPTRPL